MKKNDDKKSDSDLDKTPPVNRPEAENTGSMPGFTQSQAYLLREQRAKVRALRENLATVACRNFPLYE